MEQNTLSETLPGETPSQLDFIESIAKIADDLDRGKGDQQEHLEEIRRLLSLVPAIYGPESGLNIDLLHAPTALLRMDLGRGFVAKGNSAFLRWSYTLIGDAEALLSEPEGIQLRERCWMILDSYENALDTK